MNKLEGTARTIARKPKVPKSGRAPAYIVTNATYRDLVDDPITRILDIVDVHLKVGYTEQPCIVAWSQRSMST